nr:immunoglobulin heavy chain junction region [Mus musculus]
CARGDWEFTYW